MAKASKTTASEQWSSRATKATSRTSVRTPSASRRYTADAELAPLFVGLPDDHCQCPHMGYVVHGKVKFTFADGTEEVYETGDAYYAPPGHLPTLYAGTEVVEFSPSDQLQETMAVVEKNMAAAESG